MDIPHLSLTSGAIAIDKKQGKKQGRRRSPRAQKRGRRFGSVRSPSGNGGNRDGPVDDA